MLNYIAKIYEIILFLGLLYMLNSIFNEYFVIKISVIVLNITGVNLYTIYYTLPFAVVSAAIPNFKEFPEQYTPPAESNANIKY